MSTQCDTCGQVTTADTTAAKWRRENVTRCDKCVNRFTAGLAPGNKRPRCAACGRAGSLSGGQCAKCNEAGHEALSLFGEAS